MSGAVTGLPRPSALAGRLILAAGSIAVSTVLIEAGFRWARWGRLTYADRPDDTRIEYADRRFHHRNFPNRTFHKQQADFDATYTTNSLGLRGATLPGPKPAGVRRVLMLGDSFTFGLGVNDRDTFSAQLQKAVDPDGRRIQVINAGVPSYSPTLHYLALRDLYLDLEPDAVMLWLDFSDLQDDWLYAPHLRYGRDGEPIACDPDFTRGRPDWMGRALSHSALADYLNRKLGGSLTRMRILGFWGYLRAKWRGEDTKLNAVHMTEARRAEVPIIAYDRYLMIRGLADERELARYWTHTGAFILKIKELLAARGIPLTLVLYPYGVQVGPGQWAKGRTYFMFEEGQTYDDPRPFAFVETFAAQHGIPVINTYPAFLAARDRPLFLEWDGHWTASGHEVAARTVLQNPAFQRWLRP